VEEVPGDDAQRAHGPSLAPCARARKRRRFRTVPEPAAATSRSRGRRAVAFWVCAVLAYAVLGVFFQPFFLLGFWESLPFLLAATWLAGRLLPAR
jgi:hypothetical protein